MRNKKVILRVLDVIYEKIISDMDSLKDNYGLLDGKVGVALFLLNYAQAKESEEIEGKAGAIVEDVWTYVNTNEMPYFFNTGHTGIAWSLLWLGKQNALEMGNDILRYLRKVDHELFIMQRNKIPVSIDLESGLFTNGIYLIPRCEFPDMQPSEKYSLQEKTIYMVDECERLLYGKTSCDNLYLPELTLNAFNSIFHFLINVHKQKIYPYKTTKLLEFSCPKSIELMERADIQDIITLKYLFSMINEDTVSFVNLCNAALNNCTIHIDKTLDILSKAGFNSLIYDNTLIFKETYSCVCRDNPDILDKISDSDGLAMKDLLWTGYGLMTILNEK